MSHVLVCGGNGFIGHHLARRLKKEGHHVTVVDVKGYEYGEADYADNIYFLDLRNEYAFKRLDKDYDMVFQLAADMGGAEFVFTGEHDADIMHNSAQINLHICERFKGTKTKIFYSSSACMYPEYNQEDPNNPNCKEVSAYPAAPDSEYGWEKLFSERLYLAYRRNYGLDVRIARFHNIFGEEGTWYGGREKSPAAICRKVAQAKNGGEIEIWGDGQQTRSFLYIDECVDGVLKLMESDFVGPVNIGSDEMISINNLAKMVIGLSRKELKIKNVPSGALGVRGRNSNNDLIKEKLGWSPTQPLIVGIDKLYKWVNDQVKSTNSLKYDMQW